MDYETPDAMVRVQNHVTIVRIKSMSLTSMNDISRLTTTFDNIVAEGSLRLIVDFKLVNHIGSAALGMLISLQKKMKAVNGRMVISHPEHLQELLEVSQTVKLFELAADSKAAVKLLAPDPIA
jgi:anti-anti-sigma regulatory factor